MTLIARITTPILWLQARSSLGSGGGDARVPPPAQIRHHTRCPPRCFGRCSPRWPCQCFVAWLRQNYGCVGMLCTRGLPRHCGAALGLKLLGSRFPSPSTRVRAQCPLVERGLKGFCKSVLALGSVFPNYFYKRSLFEEVILLNAARFFFSLPTNASEFLWL